MPITRTFLGMQQAALPAAAEYLIGRFGTDSVLDLRGVLVVVPGGRAGRRLLEILVDCAQSRRLAFTPPQIQTVGMLPEFLYLAKRPFADDFVQQLAWASAMKQHNPSELSSLIVQRPDDGDNQRWLGLARLLQSLHRELASDGLEFLDVLERGEQLPGFAEAERWRTLAEIRQRYLNMLDALELWDRQTARLYAIDHRECRTESTVILLAAVDLNQSTRQMLDQVADHVTALIYAPQEWADRFDSHGCLIPEKWRDIDLNIPDESLLPAENAADQSELVVRRIAEYGGRFGADEITIGLPDERIVAQLVRQLDECRLPNRFGPGQPLSRTCVFRALEDMAAYACGRRYAEFAELVRNPDIEKWLMRSGVKPGYVEQLDSYYNEHLPVSMNGQWLGEQEEIPQLKAACQRIDELSRHVQGEPRKLTEWLPHLHRILLDLYGERSFDLEVESDRRAWTACRTVQKTLEQFEQIPESLVPVVDAAEAMQLLLDRIRPTLIPPSASESAIELVGWLELPLDDAPALIVTSFNEGLVPSSVNADMFLPGGLRSALGLDDNSRRYARDAYAVASLLTPWRSTTFIVARRLGDDEPLAPSRLLFAAPEETVARRCLRFFDEAPKREPQPPLAGAMVTTRAESSFEIPRPVKLAEPITHMSVTSFRAYLACPYRYYLSHVLRLAGSNDDATELDGAGFGNLAHNVLERFGRSDACKSADAEVIDRELVQLLNEMSREYFGTRPGAAIKVQLEQLRLRLHALAQWQAARTASGWRIEHTERSFSKDPGELLVDGHAMKLTGRIDRIDIHEGTGQRMILDYKTSDAGDSPEKSHRRKSGEWTDLQLPLYRHLVPKLGIDPKAVRLGYIVLPKKVADVGLVLGEWTEEDLASADLAASEVVRNVRSERFWPPIEPPPAFSEEFAAICMDGVFGRKISS